MEGNSRFIQFFVAADGLFKLALSTEILFEYEEITTKLSGADRWHNVAGLLNLVNQIHGNILHVMLRYRFRVIIDDPDDNKFCDCAIRRGS